MKKFEVQIPITVVAIAVSFSFIFAGVVQANQDLQKTFLVIGIGLLLLGGFNVWRLEKELDAELRKLEELNYIVEEPTQNKKRELVVNIMKKLSDKGYYSTILNEDEHEVGRITRNALIAYAICGGRWSEYSERYIAGNYSIEMGRLGRIHYYSCYYFTFYN